MPIPDLEHNGGFVFASSKSEIPAWDKPPMDAVKWLDLSNIQFFYLQYYPRFGGPPDPLERLTKGLHGAVVQVWSPEVFGLAIQRMLAQIDSTEQQWSPRGPGSSFAVVQASASAESNQFLEFFGRGYKRRGSSTRSSAAGDEKVLRAPSKFHIVKNN